MQLRSLVRSTQPGTRFLRSIPSSSRVLDVGCGSGNNGITLRSLVQDVEIHGCDLDIESPAPEWYSYQSVDLDKGELPWPDAHFDAVIFTHVIEHLRNPWTLARELHRVMKSNGRLYIEAPNWTSALVPSFGFRREQHHPFNFFDDPTHVKPWTRHGLYEYLMQYCGLTVEKVGGTRSLWRLPFDIPTILLGLVTGRRPYIVSSVWNLVGWCVYGIGIKRPE